MINTKKNTKLSKEIEKMVEARTNFMATNEVDAIVKVTTKWFVDIVNEDATREQPVWVGDKELREFGEMIAEIASDDGVPSACKVANSYKEEYTSLMTEILAAMKDLNRAEHARLYKKLQRLFESYGPKMEKEMSTFGNVMAKSVDKIKAIDPTLLPE